MSTIGLPNIDIIFTQKAVTAIERSERGILAICLYDSKVSAVTKRIYRYETDINASDYDEANLKAIKRAFLVSVNKVYVISAPVPGEDKTAQMSDFTPTLEGMKYNYVCVLDHSLQQELVNYIITKNSNSAGKKYVAVTENVTTVDSKYVINLKGSYVHDVDTNSNIDMTMYLPRITSILCNLPLNRSITYYELEDIDKVDDSFINTEHDIDYWINEGNLILFEDDDVIKVGRGVNTLTTFNSTDTEDMRKIIIMESINLMIEDIYNVFKDYYVGKYKNSLDNQRLFISSVNAYFRSLQREEILDPAYDNEAFVDIEMQREAWLAVGKTEAADWDKEKVEEMTFKSYVYLAGNVKILDAIEDLKFTISMA